MQKCGIFYNLKLMYRGTKYRHKLQLMAGVCMCSTNWDFADILGRADLRSADFHLLNDFGFQPLSSPGPQLLFCLNYFDWACNLHRFSYASSQLEDCNHVELA